MTEKSRKTKMNKKRSRRIKIIIFFELFLVVGIIAVVLMTRSPKGKTNPNPNQNQDQDQGNGNEDVDQVEEDPYKGLSEEEVEAIKEQERLRLSIAERQELIEEADRLTVSYDYDGAIDIIKSYQGDEGGYEVYPNLIEAVNSLEERKNSLLLYGGEYSSVAEVHHVFFHSLIADNSKAFDGDYDSVGYNMYMTTTSEFINMMQSMYDDGFVLVKMHDLVEEVTDDNGNTKFVQSEIYLPEGKKPFILSQDDVNYYDYMLGDGFASRIVIGEDGRPTTEMVLDDGSIVTGPYDIVPLLNDFIDENPDFSYRGAKGVLAITGYEGTLGYRTNDPQSPTYEEDKVKAKEVAEALRADGWEFASHSWGHRNSQTMSYESFKKDTDRWNDEVAPLIGPTDIYIFPFGIDIETTMGHYNSNKYHLLKEYGFNFFCGVYSKPWMHLKDDYIRMTRRPLDGQAMLEFPERLEDLFDLEEIIDPERPGKNW